MPPDDPAGGLPAGHAAAAHVASRRSAVSTAYQAEPLDEHPEARYPLAVFHGHFPGLFLRRRAPG